MQLCRHPRDDLGVEEVELAQARGVHLNPTQVGELERLDAQGAGFVCQAEAGAQVHRVGGNRGRQVAAWPQLAELGFVVIPESEASVKTV